MKVVEQCGLSRRAGGLYYAVSALCRAINGLGTELLVVGKKDSFNAEDQGIWEPVKTQAYRTFGPLETSLDLRRILREENPDLVHHHGLWLDDQWAAFQWQKRTERPMVISPHGMLDPWAVKNSAWKKRLVGSLFADESLHNANVLHALCQSEADAIRSYGLKNPIATIPNGVDLPEAPLQTEPREGRKRLLFLGRIHPKKGLAELLEGWVAARRRNPKQCAEWQLLVAGWDDGGHLAGLRQQAEALEISHRETSAYEREDAELLFVGPQFGDEKDQLLRYADAFILPSFSEGLPVSVLEAWSYGLPAVLTDFCNLPEGFSADAAIRIEPNADSVSAGLELLMQMSALELRGMGVKGRTLVESRFTWSRIARDMNAVYEWCLGGERPACMGE